MKEIAEQRITNSLKINEDTLIEVVKNADPIRFDEMLIENSERKNYFYVSYKALAYKRTVKLLKFPLLPEIKSEFNKTIKNFGEPSLLENDKLIILTAKWGNSSVESPRHTSNSALISKLPIILNQGNVNPKQARYYIPEDTTRKDCPSCDGDKYLRCNERKCNGKHNYNCDECNGDGETNCPTCSGRGRLDCKGYVGAGSGTISNYNYSCKN